MDKLLQAMDATAADGKRYKLLVYQPWANAGTHDDPDAKIPGFPRIVTPSGQKVNRIEKGVYEVLTNQGVVRVTTNDPKAF